MTAAQHIGPGHIGSADDLRFVADYAAYLTQIGPHRFREAFKRSVLVGYGIVAPVAETPTKWRRRTLPIDPETELMAVQSILDRVWPITKDPGAPRSPKGPRIILGASAECDIVIPDYTVSAKHCAFAFEPGRLLMTDLESLNGTFASGARLNPRLTIPVADGAPLQIGRIKMQYLSRDRFLTLVTLHAQNKR